MKRYIYLIMIAHKVSYVNLIEPKLTHTGICYFKLSQIHIYYQCKYRCLQYCIFYHKCSQSSLVVVRIGGVEFEEWSKTTECLSYAQGPEVDEELRVDCHQLLNVAKDGDNNVVTKNIQYSQRPLKKLQWHGTNQEFNSNPKPRAPLYAFMYISRHPIAF